MNTDCDRMLVQLTRQIGEMKRQLDRAHDRIAELADGLETATELHNDLQSENEKLETEVRCLKGVIAYHEKREAEELVRRNI